MLLTFHPLWTPPPSFPLHFPWSFLHIQKHLSASLYVLSFQLSRLQVQSLLSVPISASTSLSFEHVTHPVDSQAWTLGVRLVALLWKTVEPVGCGALVEAVDRWGRGGPLETSPTCPLCDDSHRVPMQLRLLGPLPLHMINSFLELEAQINPSIKFLSGLLVTGMKR